jgi:hypothetical protein
MTDTALEAVLFAAVGTKQGHRRHVEPDWAEIHRELKRKHVTLAMLWDEYIERHPEGYRYSRFCELYRGWAWRLSVTMRQAHAGGDKLFVDSAGDTVPVIVDRLTGQVRPAQIFVAVMGLQLHLCRGELDAGAGRLGRRPYPSLHSAQRRAQTAGAGLCSREHNPAFVPSSVMWRAAANSCRRHGNRPHINQRAASHSSSFGSLCQTGLRGGPTEEVEGSWHASNASCFILMLISA